MNIFRAISFIAVLTFLSMSAVLRAAPDPDAELTTVPTTTPTNIKAQRVSYKKAMQAVRLGRITEYKRLHAKLDGYPLQIHAEYAYLMRNIASASPETIRRFLKNSSHTYTADRLRERWLKHLAAEQRWTLFMGEYRPHLRDSALRCHWMDRRLRSADADQWTLMSAVEKLWLSSNRLPSACNVVFERWRQAGHMSRELVFARIKLAMERRRLSFARELARYLGARDRVWVERWVAMHRSPARELANIKWPLDTPVARMIVKHGVVRLSYRDPEEAMRVWLDLKSKQQFFGEDDNYVLRRVGILAAKRHLPQAVTWLAAVSADAGDHDLLYWRIRASLRVGNWKLAKHFISALSEEEQEKEEWRYWRARIAEQSNQSELAWNLYSELSRERSYYGFLAADIIGAPYSMQHRSVGAKPEESSAMAGRPTIRYAGELFQVGQIVDARRQWHWVIRHMSKRDLQIAAVLALKWGWHDRAVLTVSRSGHLDDLDLRFPVLYREKVETNSRRTGIDLGWIYGVMRQESAFMADARSGAGALGLMQLMPRTGRATARQLRLKIRSRSAILNVDNNLRLGTYHLRVVLKRNNNNQAMATAAYNAGSHRVKRWLPKDKPMSPDVWVDTIPFDETRGYVKNVMGFAAIYEHRLKIIRTRLRERMLIVNPR